MEGKKLIIFDQDGTLVDTAGGSTRCMDEVARMLGKKVPSREDEYRALCGPFGHNIKWLYGLTDEEVLPAVFAYVKAYDAVEGYFDYEEFPGACDMVRELSGRYMLSVATMMLGDFSVKTLSSLDIDGCFLTIQGTNMTEWLTKQDIIGRCLAVADCTPEETVMIGDSQDDLEAARKAGIDFIGVTYGYQLREEDCIRQNVPFARKPSDLLQLL